jgi:hypothetical protein
MEDAKAQTNGRSHGSDVWMTPGLGVWMMTPRLGRMEEAKARMNGRNLG